MEGSGPSGRVVKDDVDNFKAGKKKKEKKIGKVEIDQKVPNVFLFVCI